MSPQASSLPRWLVGGDREDGPSAGHRSHWTRSSLTRPAVEISQIDCDWVNRHSRQW